MLGVFRRRRLPADKRPVLAPEERIVAWAGTAGDGVVVVTNQGLWLPDEYGRLSRLGWHEIHKATWSGRQLAIIAAEQVGDAEEYAVMADRPPLVHTLLDPDRVPDQVRTRVTRSVAYTSHHLLPGGGGVRVVARRVSGVDGLCWTVRYDQGTDPADEGVPETTRELVKAARGQTPG
jgi:hypothetical protein